MSTKKSKVETKSKFKKGVSKIQSEKDTEDNPLLKIESNLFLIEAGNIIENPWIFINPDYENFSPRDKSTIDSTRVNMDSEFLVILRYYEYVITARFTVGFIWPLWSNGEKTGDMSLGDIFDGIDHRLQNELFLRSPNFDDVDILGLQHLYKIRYITKGPISSKAKEQEKEDLELPM